MRTPIGVGRDRDRPVRCRCTRSRSSIARFITMRSADARQRDAHERPEAGRAAREVAAARSVVASVGGLAAR